MRTRVCAAGVAVCSMLGVAAPAAALPARQTPTVVVASGQSIQAAIDAAAPGTRVVVGPGTFAEQLTITKNGIQLVGYHATLVPPATVSTNTCSGIAVLGPPVADSAPAQAGICVAGDVVVGPFDEVLGHRGIDQVRAEVTGVRITGLAVKGFGVGVIVAGGRHTRLKHLRVSGVDPYGLLATSSPGTRYIENTVTNGPDTVSTIGMCQARSDGGQFTGNVVSGFIIGLCLSSSDLTVRNNRITGNQIGVFVDPGYHDITVAKNVISDNRRVQPFPVPVPTGIGVLVLGAHHLTIEHNRISDNAFDNGPDDVSAGIVLFDAGETLLAHDITVRRNWLSDNGAGALGADLINLASGAGLVFSGNRCDTSIGGSYC